jgi:hypothetical protein
LVGADVRFRTPYALAGCVLGFLAMFLGFFSAGAGHGDYVVARCILPFACAVITHPLALMFFGLFQWPAYGLLLQWTRHRMMIGSMIACIHVGLVLWLFTRGADLFR